MADFNLLPPAIDALKKPSPKNSAIPIHIAAIQGYFSYFIIAEVIIKGRIGKNPNNRKEINVTNPHFIAAIGSNTERWSFSAIIILTNVYLFVDRISEIRFESYVEKFREA